MNFWHLGKGPSYGFKLPWTFPDSSWDHVRSYGSPGGNWGGHRNFEDSKYPESVEIWESNEWIKPRLRMEVHSPWEGSDVVWIRLFPRRRWSIMAKNPSFGVGLLCAKSESNMYVLCVLAKLLSLFGSLGLHLYNENKNQECARATLHLPTRACTTPPSSAFGDTTLPAWHWPRRASLPWKLAETTKLQNRAF